MNLFPLAASDMDVIIGIIAVVGWILAQIFGKKKVDPSNPEGSTPETGSSPDPRDELRKFFAELENAAKPPAPQPVAPPPLQPRAHKEKVVRRNQEPRAEPLSSQNRPVYSAVESAQVFQGMGSRPSVSRSLPKPIPTPAMPELRDPLALRKFIIANEILGKPLALRQG